jgi:hypothetical protein
VTFSPPTRVYKQAMTSFTPQISLPNLPGLSEQDVYAVVTSPHRRDTSDEEETWEHDLGDRTRLAMLGMSIMDMVATQLLLMVRPVLGAEALQVQCTTFASDRRELTLKVNL